MPSMHRRKRMLAAKQLSSLKKKDSLWEVAASVLTKVRPFYVKTAVAVGNAFRKLGMRTMRPKSSVQGIKRELWRHDVRSFRSVMKKNKVKTVPYKLRHPNKNK